MAYPEMITTNVFSSKTWKNEKTVLYFVGIWHGCPTYAKDPKNKNTFYHFSKKYIKEKQ